MKSRVYVYMAVLILALGVFFRLGFPSLAGFGMDEEGVMCRILDDIRAHRLPPPLTVLHGIPAINIVSMAVYLIMLFTQDPRIVILIFNGIPNTIAVILCFLFCYKFMNKRTALVAAALFGFSGWAILFSKGLWGVNALQFFSISVFYILMLYAAKPKWQIVILLLLILFLLPGVHLTSISIFISAAVIFFIIRCGKLPRRYVLTIVAMIIFLPPLSYLLTNGFYGNVKLERGILIPNISFKAIYTSMDIITTGGWFYEYLGIVPRYRNMEIFTGVFFKILFSFGCVYLIKRTVSDLKDRQISAYGIIAIWYFVFVVLLGFTNMTCFLHYFMVVLPALFIIISIGFFSIIDRITGREKLQPWEVCLLSLIFVIWSPIAATVTVFIVLIAGKFKFFAGGLIRKASVYVLYFCMIFILLFQALSNMDLMSGAQRNGGVPGRAGWDVGSKIKAVEYIINDAGLKYKKTGMRSYYSLVNDAYYAYFFRYLLPKEEKFIAEDKTNCGYHYEIICDFKGTVPVEKTKNYLYHKRFGCILVIVKGADEK